MADPILLDKNVITSISRNNKPAADALARYLASDTPVYISKAAYDELVTRAQTLKQSGEYEWLLRDARINVAPPGNMQNRVDVYADNIQHMPSPNQPQLKDYSRKDDPSKPGDIFVVAQAKGINARLWTFDAKVRNAAPTLGVSLVPECGIGDVSGPEDVTVGRKLLGLNPRLIGPNGKPVPTGGTGSGGGGGGGHSIVGVADNTLPETGGPSPKGQAIVGGIQLAFEGINFVLNLVNEQIQKKKVTDALDNIRPAVAAARANNPRMGVLLLFYYTQYQAPDESIIKPGAAFDYVIWGKGATRDEALRDALSTPTISRGTGPNESKFSREVWIPQLVKATVTTAKCPFPPIAVGRFWLGNSNKAKFQLVEFNIIGGFDDVVEKSIDLPLNTNADFVVLQPPPQVYWFNLNGRQPVDVPLKDAQTANGNTIKVVDLDPWSPFNAKAAMVYPLDNWTEQVFASVGPTSGYQTLSTYVNFSMIRWIRPVNIHLLRFLSPP
jgi:predicted nucleic acid-binding protein